MKLNYKVLWIDDQPRNVAAAQDYVRTRLARQGFNLDVVEVRDVPNERSFRNKLKDEWSDVDVVLLDLDLGDKKDSGDHVAKIVRMNMTATEIVFYSEVPVEELRAKIAKQGIDGVYCSRRSRLGEKALDVISTTIKKVLDLNSLRGVVMDTLAEFDYIIEVLVQKVIDGLEEDEQAEVKKQIINTASSYHTKQLEIIGGLTNDSPLDNYMDLLSSNPRYQLLRELLEKKSTPEWAHRLDRLRGYGDEIIQPRNTLAHGKARKEKDCYVVITRKSEKKYTHPDFIGLIRSLNDHLDNLTSIAEELGCKL